MKILIPKSLRCTTVMLGVLVAMGGCAVCDPTGPEQGLGATLACAGAQGLSGGSASGPTNRPFTCEEVGGDPITRYGARVVTPIFSMDVPAGKWCQSTDGGFNGVDRFSFYTSPLLHQIYPSGTAPQEYIAHSFSIQALPVKLEEVAGTSLATTIAEISTADGLKSYVVRNSDSAEVTTTDFIPGSICVWEGASTEYPDTKQPTWTVMYIEKALICRHPNLADTLVALRITERKRKGWNAPYSELTRLIQDQATASLRSLRFESQ